MAPHINYSNKIDTIKYFLLHIFRLVRSFSYYEELKKFFIKKHRFLKSLKITIKKNNDKNLLLYDLPE